MPSATGPLLIKGARQIGKTSMLAQGAHRARELGWRQGLTDFQKFNTAQMGEGDRFYRLLAATLARQLRFEYDFETGWDAIFGANLNLESFLRALLEASDAHLVWFMDEVDKLFSAPFASDFFGLVRDDGSRKPSWGAFRDAANAFNAGCGAHFGSETCFIVRGYLQGVKTVKQFLSPPVRPQSSLCWSHPG